MPRTRLSAAAGLVLAFVLTLAGCTSGGAAPSPVPTGTSSANTQDLQALSQVKVTGALGSRPTVVLPSVPFTVTTVAVRLIQDGSGVALSDGDGLLVQQELVDGATGQGTDSTWGSTPVGGLVVGQNTGVGTLDDVLRGAHVGARILMAYPTGLTSTAAPAGSQVIVIDVTGTYRYVPEPTGSATPSRAGLPSATVGDSGPTLTRVAGSAPTTLQVQTLITGDGPVISAGQALTVKYALWLWASQDTTPLQSSWSTGAPTQFTLKAGDGGVIAGWVQGLVGQTVGSRVLLVVPPDLGYGSAGKDPVPGGATLIFVVDLIAAF